MTNFELVAEWRHLDSGGNSGIFVWAPEKALEGIKPELAAARAASRCRSSTTATRSSTRKSSGKKATWFTTNGDVFPVGTSKMTPFPPVSPDGSRSFPTKHLSKGVGEWNHYYVRGINGEVRLWVNGEEVSGGTGCEPRSGYLCLESEGSPGRVPQAANPRTAVTGEHILHVDSRFTRIPEPIRFARCAASVVNRAASIRRHARGRLIADARFRTTWRSTWCAPPRRPRWRPRAGWAGATRTPPTRRPSTPCGCSSTRCTWTASSSSARGRRTRRRCSTTASGSARATRRRWTSPSTRSTARAWWRRARPTRCRSSPSPSAARCSTRARASTWRRSSPAARPATAIDITAPIEANIRNVAQAKRLSISDVTVMILDRPRHEEVVERVRKMGARVYLLSDGDVAGAITAARRGTGVDLLYGIGGTPEGVVAAAALKCLGGAIQGRLYPRDDEERKAAIDGRLRPRPRPDRPTISSRATNVFFACTGITDGALFQGVRFFPDGATTESIVMRAASGTIRVIRGEHRVGKLKQIYGEE